MRPIPVGSASRQRLAAFCAILLTLVVASTCSQHRSDKTSDGELLSRSPNSTANVPPRAIGSYPAPSGFTMMSELSGDSAGLAAQYLAWGLADSVAFHAPLSAAEQSLVTSLGLPFIFRNTPIDLGTCFTDAFDPHGAASMQ